MKVVSFLSDFGLKDNFVGVVKAVILKINPSVQIVDICHNITPHNILEASFILKGSFRFFPKDTIHLAIVDPGVGTERKKIIVKTKDFYFVAPDNGLLSLALEKQPPLKIIEITQQKYFLKPVSFTFHGRDIFASVVGHISKGIPIERFGREVYSYKRLVLPKVKIKNNCLEAEIIYTDRFGNLITNIEADEFKKFVGGKRFKIQIKDFCTDQISKSYQEAKDNQIIAIMNSFDCLEIALKEKSAAQVLGLKKGNKVRITIF